MTKKTKRVFLSLLLTLATVFFGFGLVSCEQEETPTTYTVTFVSEFGVAPPAQTVEAGQTATQPEAPTHDIHEFQKWIREGVYDGTPYDFSTPVTQNITLYAFWNFNYLITFDSNGGSNVPDLISDGFDLQEPETPVKAQQYFLGWYLPDNTKFTFDQNGENLLREQLQLHLTAKWEDTLTTDALVGSWTFWPYDELNTSGQPTLDDPVFSVTFTENGYVCTHYHLQYAPDSTPITEEGSLSVVENQYVLTNASSATATLVYNETTDTWELIDLVGSSWWADDYDDWWVRANEETMERSNGAFQFQAGTYTATVPALSGDVEYLCTLVLTESGLSTITLNNDGYSLTVKNVWNFADRLFVEYDLFDTANYFILQWKDGTLQGFDLWTDARISPEEQSRYPLDFDVTFTKQA